MAPIAVFPAHACAVRGGGLGARARGRAAGRAGGAAGMRPRGRFWWARAVLAVGTHIIRALVFPGVLKHAF